MKYLKKSLLHVFLFSLIVSFSFSIGMDAKAGEDPCCNACPPGCTPLVNGYVFHSLCIKANVGESCYNPVPCECF